MKKASEFIQFSEAVISSKLHLEAIFSGSTTETVQRILMDGTKKYVKDTKTFKGVSNATSKQFAEYVADMLNRVPNFLHNHISFEAQPHSFKKKGSLFGEGSHSTFMEIMTIHVNSMMAPQVWRDAWNSKFDLEIKRLRSVIRHEMAHRVHLQKAHQDPVKRMSSRKYRKLMIPHKNSHSYFGMPTEILAHANHTVELMYLGHERGWKETIAQYALTDNTRNFKNTRRLIWTIGKLMVEYDIPWKTRLKLKRELLVMARQMRVSVKDLGYDELDKALDTALKEVDPDAAKSVRFMNKYGEK